jgi:hypothetical protein
MIQCAGSCRDQACSKGCFAQGTAVAQAAASAIVSCIVRAQCKTQDCIATSCRDEVAACAGVGDAGAGSVASASPAPPRANGVGSVLPRLVGTWRGRDHMYKFGADGSVWRSMSTASYTARGNLACAYAVDNTGSVRQQGDILVFTWTRSGAMSGCGGRSEDGPSVESYRFSWYDYEYDNPDLGPMPRLTSLDCPYTTEASIGLYCAEVLYR